MSWKIIDNHRSAARNIKFNILIWGPSREDTKIYDIREKIKDYLNKVGHSAKFSEDLMDEGEFKAAPDPIMDEMFHADAANVIIVLYKSRGTQSEADRILKYDRFAKKSLIFVEQKTWRLLSNSISYFRWKELENNVIKVERFDNDYILKEILEFIEKLQFSNYLRKIELKLLI